MVEQVYIHIDYILELLKLVLTNIMTIKIRYLGKIIKFSLRLVLFLELLLKIPDGFIVFSALSFSAQKGLSIEGWLFFFIACQKINSPIGQSLSIWLSKDQILDIWSLLSQNGARLHYTLMNICASWTQ